MKMERKTVAEIIAELSEYPSTALAYVYEDVIVITDEFTRAELGLVKAPE